MTAEPPRLSTDEEDVLFSAWEGEALWALSQMFSGGFATTKSRTRAIPALARLLEAGLVDLSAMEIDREGKGSGRYEPLSPTIVAEILRAAAPWIPGGVFRIGGRPCQIYLGLTPAGRAAFEAGASGQAVVRASQWPEPDESQ